MMWFVWLSIGFTAGLLCGFLVAAILHAGHDADVRISSLRRDAERREGGAPCASR
jgi:hypothetical protein